MVDLPAVPCLAIGKHDAPNGLVVAQRVGVGIVRPHRHRAGAAVDGHHEVLPNARHAHVGFDDAGTEAQCVLTQVRTRPGNSVVPIAAIEDVGVVSRAASQAVVANPAFERVLPEPTRQRVVAQATEQRAARCKRCCGVTIVASVDKVIGKRGSHQCQTTTC